MYLASILYRAYFRQCGRTEVNTTWLVPQGVYKPKEAKYLTHSPQKILSAKA